MASDEYVWRPRDKTLRFSPDKECSDFIKRAGARLVLERLLGMSWADFKAAHRRLRNLIRGPLHGGQG